MIYVGLDIASKSFVVHAVNDKKAVLYMGSVEPTRAGLRGLHAALPEDNILYVSEAGNQMKWIAATLRQLPRATVHVVHPNHIKWINESSGKTDKIDAKKMAELARGDLLPTPVRVVEGKNRKLRELASARHLLQSKRIALVNTLRGYCKQEGHSLPEKFFQSSFWQEKIKSLKVSDNLKIIIEAMMPAVERLVQSEKELSDRMNEITSKEIELLETIPAVGKLSSRIIASAVDDVSRFASSKKVSKYGALTPTIYQSGNTLKLGRICHDGRHEVRRVLLQCAHTVTRMKTLSARPLREFYERIEKRSGKKRAVVALARKLLTTAYGVLKSGRPYDPAKVTAAAPA
jgi:transposase